MDQVLSILGFSLGASLGIGAVRSFGEGSRTVVRDTVKAGIRVWDAVTGAAGGARADGGAPGGQAPSGRSRRRAEPRKIAIAHE